MGPPAVGREEAAAVGSPGPPLWVLAARLRDGLTIEVLGRLTVHEVGPVEQVAFRLLSSLPTNEPFWRRVQGIANMNEFGLSSA